MKYVRVRLQEVTFVCSGIANSADSYVLQNHDSDIESFACRM